MALIGGTGPEGKGLAARFAVAGLDVLIGSRSAERGDEVAGELRDLLARDNLRGVSNADAAAGAAVTLVTLPYSAQNDTLSPLKDALAGKVVVSTVVPLEFVRGRGPRLLDVPAGSAAAEMQALLPDSRVTGAFHNLAAAKLLAVAQPVESDVVVCGDDADAVQATIDLAALIEGVRGVRGGPIANCHYVEGMTALLININRLYKTETGIKIVGI